MRVIIRCAGDGTRWDNYRGVPKHLVPLCGEPLLHRTVRLTTELAPDADVRVVVSSLADRRYDKPDPANGDLWSTTDRTVLLWGDTWWDRDALDDVLTGPLDGPHAWLRAEAAGGEIFAFAFGPDSVDTVDDALGRALDAHVAGDLAAAGYNARPLRGGWALYRALTGVEWDDHGDHGMSTVVDGWTEDMDTPRDWDEWCLRWAQSDPSDRPEHRGR